MFLPDELFTLMQELVYVWSGRRLWLLIIVYSIPLPSLSLAASFNGVQQGTRMDMVSDRD